VKKFDVTEIRSFLETLDRHLSGPVRLTVVGGSAALLQHGARSPTRDIDTFDCDPTLVRDAATKAQAEIGFAVPIQNAAIGDLPRDYQSRLLHPMPKLKQLHVVVPDRYDLALSKLLRATQPDLDICKEMHTSNPLDPKVLLDRYLAEMGHAIGSEADHDQNLVAAVEFLWDEATADRAQQQVDAHRRNLK
jgi:hypothetical protein